MLLDGVALTLLITTISFLFWFVLGLVIDWIITTFFFHNEVIRMKALGFRSRILSTFHAALISATSFYTICTQPQLWQDPIYGESRIGEVVCFTFLGYCIYDTFSMWYWLNESLAMYTHHILAGSAAILHALMPTSLLIGIVALAMMEITNPCLHIMWILRQLKMEGSTLYLINGAVFVLLYFVFRIATCGYLSFVFLRIYYERGLWTLNPHIIAPLFVLFISFLSYFWFFKIVTIFCKAWRQRFPRKTL